MADTKPVDDKPAAAPSAAPAATSVVEVPIKGEDGKDAGYTIKIDNSVDPVEDDPNGIKTLQKRIVGWSKFLVDGEAYSYSAAKALDLLHRFPHIAAQLKKASK